VIAGATTGLSFIALVLGGTIVVELVDRSPPPALFAAPIGVPHVGSHDVGSPTRDDVERGLSTILARPVFSPDRKPIVIGTKGIAGLPRLTGIVVSGSSKIAIFAGPAGGRPVIAEERSHIDSYEVKAISDMGVTIAGPNGTRMLTPIFDATLQPASKQAGSAVAKPGGKEANGKGR
jgi:hypothetical protein